jgi:hypothetical protein
LSVRFSNIKIEGGRNRRDFEMILSVQRRSDGRWPRSELSYTGV